jgi:16S rRNA (cytidine1402-2'-O)-methyltransferase
LRYNDDVDPDREFVDDGSPIASSERDEARSWLSLSPKSDWAVMQDLLEKSRATGFGSWSLSVQEYSPRRSGAEHHRARRVDVRNLVVGTLFVVATPIGNLEDLSPRALRTLREVSLIAAEDTRHSRGLLTHFGVDTPLISYHQHNQRERRERLLSALDSGDVALITDAGTPAISDPGADLVAAALASGHRVSPIPGPSALSSAVSASGLIDGPFLSLGFLPRERVDRQITLARAAASGMPLVIFESARRLGSSLRDLREALGDRQAVMLRELTKIHEEVRAGTLGELSVWSASAPLRGEVALVVSGAEEARSSQTDAESVVRALRQSGLSASQTAREAATITGLPRSELYRLATAVDLPGSVGLEGQLSLPDQNALEDALGDQEGPE